MADPFLDVGEFAARFRPLSDVESALADDYLQVVSDWIRDNRPDIDDIDSDDPAAKLVVFEVTREAILWGKYSGLTTFEETTAHRTKAGTVQFREIEKFITSRHRRMLGLFSGTGARGHFPVCDY